MHLKKPQHIQTNPGQGRILDLLNNVPALCYNLLHAWSWNRISPWNSIW